MNCQFGGRNGEMWKTEGKNCGSKYIRHWNFRVILSRSQCMTYTKDDVKRIFFAHKIKPSSLFPPSFLHFTASGVYLFGIQICFQHLLITTRFVAHMLITTRTKSLVEFFEHFKFLFCIQTFYRFLQQVMLKIVLFLLRRMLSTQQKATERKTSMGKILEARIECMTLLAIFKEGSDLHQKKSNE